MGRKRKLLDSVSAGKRLLYNMCISKRSGIDHTGLPANTPCPPFLRKHSPDGATPNIRLQLTTHIYRPRRDERLSWPGWLTYTGRITHVSGHPSATGRAQDRPRATSEGRSFTGPPNLRGRGPPKSYMNISARILYAIIKSNKQKHTDDIPF